MKRCLYKITFLFILLSVSNPLFSQYWQKIQNIPSPFSNNYWLDVYFHPSNPNYGWICGFNGMIIRTTDGGNTWRGSTVNAYHLESIHFPSLQIGYVSGVEGIFKSTDGGATWFDVTPPNTRDTTHFWGCYFLNENYGVLVGDGCFGRNQHFWLTTDGGSTWSVFLGTENNSGMTDALLYPNGLGYASSSGRIWITIDSGRTWQIFATSGPNLWQEEITNYGSSFLVPYSGTTCTGGGNDGGMRFSTNNGTTWNSFRTGVPMFGTFLIDSQKGWACGYYTEVYYTSNGGSNWQRRNCGIQSGNLDDLWFINENNGWVVGEGVYKLSNPIGVVNKQSINFAEFCVGSKKFDTLWVKNYNFNDVTISLNINSPTNEFEIFSPGTTGYIQSCDSIRVIVSFAPKTPGTKNATLQIQYPYQNPITVSITGRAIVSTAKLIDTLITVNYAKCGFTYQVAAKIGVNDVGEFVSTIIPSKESRVFKLITQLPLQLDPSRNNLLNFEITPYDTGWQEITYRVRFSPCDTFQVLKIKVYAFSPIINLDSAINIDLHCKITPIKLRIFNTGNDTLFFRKFSFSPPTNKLILQGWASGNNLLSNFILPGRDDTLLILLDTNNLGAVSTTLIIESNDLRTVNGQRNVVHLKINVRIFVSKITFQPKIVNFGKVCVGDTSYREVNFLNQGNLEELFLTFVQSNKLNFFVKNTFPITLKSFDSLKIRIAFSPNRIGKFSDTLTFVSFNCRDTLKVICIGEGVKAGINVVPKQIILRIQRGLGSSILFSFFRVVDDTNRLESITVSDSLNELVANIKLLRDSTLMSFDSLLIEFSFFASKKGRYFGTIYVHFKGNCDIVISIPVQIDVFDKNTVIDPLHIDFDSIICKKEINKRSIVIKNISEAKDTIKNIVLLQKTGSFSFNSLPSFPLILPPNDSFEIQILYFPLQEGYDTANILIEFDDTTRNVQIVATGFFGYSKLLSSPKLIDFGSLEYCEIPKQLKFIIKNIGNIEDTILIIKNFSSSLFSFEVSRYFLLGNSLDSSEFLISLLKSDKLGELIDTLVIGFSKCPQMDTIIVKCSIVSPKYEILPKFIDLGNLWIGTQKNGNFKIINKHNNGIGLKVGSYNVSKNFGFDSNFSIYLEPNQTKTFEFYVIATQEGEYWDTICFEISSVCKYYDCIIVHYNIPKEQYKMTFKVGKYIAKPGDDIEIKIENLTPNNFLKLDTLLIGLSYDKWLFYPYSFKVGDVNFSAETNFGKIFFKLSENYLIDFLNSGKPISIFGKALYSAPDTTLLELSIVDYFPKKNIDISLFNGLLYVYPVCEPIGSLKMELIPSFNVIGFYYDVNDSFVVLISSENQQISISLFDVLGNSFGTIQTNLERGLNIIELSNTLKIYQQNSEFFLVFSNSYSKKILFVPFLR
ncbi:MAG: choice-of-anchor D domain-containing protein [Ignavibacteria bacterium]|nr:choice-of-anchor D domain-containing protein [Ignavibacteria bacterium]